MPIADVKARRDAQRRCKAEERALTKQLVSELDALLPAAEGSFPSDSMLSKRKGFLPSRRNQQQLLRDAVLCVQREVVRPSGEDLLAAMLSTREDREMVVELSTWRVRGMSERLLEDYNDSAFVCSIVGRVGQVLLHFVDHASADKLRRFSQYVLDNVISANQNKTWLDPFDVNMRMFRSHNVVIANFKFVPTSVKNGICFFHLTGSTNHIKPPDWSRMNFSSNEGIMQYSKGRSNATPWYIERAMSCITLSRKRFLGWILPAHETQPCSRQVCDWMKDTAVSRFASLRRAFHDLVITHQDAHFLFDGSSSSFPTLCVHIRFCLPQLMGGIKTPWVKLLQRKLDGSAFAPFSGVLDGKPENHHP
eukprot:762736-Hanusia_phi.AAC.1